MQSVVECIKHGFCPMLTAGSIAAEREIDSGASDEFYKIKIIIARFYNEHILPRSQAYASTEQRGVTSTMELSNENF